MPRRIAGALKGKYVPVRFPPQLVDQMDQLVRIGKFKTRTELIITAVRDYLDWLEGRK